MTGTVVPLRRPPSDATIAEAQKRISEVDTLLNQAHASLMFIAGKIRDEGKHDRDENINSAIGQLREAQTYIQKCLSSVHTFMREGYKPEDWEILQGIPPE